MVFWSREWLLNDSKGLLVKTLTGLQLIGFQELGKVDDRFKAFDPNVNSSIEPAFSEAEQGTIEQAALLAERDFDQYRLCTADKRAELLSAIAAELTNLQADLIARAHQETGLSTVRLQAELNRTCQQLNLFAAHLQTVAPSPIQPEENRSKIRKADIALGPVGIFGASNFPLAFSVAGGDTASALAAGCPVIVKGHPAHPGTSELAGRAILRAVKSSGMPEGTFSLLQGRAHQVGETLVLQPGLKAVAFTGSLSGGRALYNLAATRPQPIPVYAEMGSINPVFVLPKSLAAHRKVIYVGFVESMTLGAGQFCTNPGLLVAINEDSLELFCRETVEQISQQTAATMLHPGIKQNFICGLERLESIPGVQKLVGRQLPTSADCRVMPVLYRTTAEVFLNQRTLSEEVFGPASLLVVCQSFSEMLAVGEHLQGQLTASVHALPEEEQLSRELFRTLERKAGRLLLNDFPTGVEVCSAMTHGGPYPATTDSRSTSVGTAAMQRFLRPISYQNFTQDLLPAVVKD